MIGRKPPAAAQPTIPVGTQSGVQAPAGPTVKPAVSSSGPTALPVKPQSSFGAPAAAPSTAPEPKRASVLPEKKTILDGLKDPNYFGEKDDTSPFRFDASSATAARTAFNRLQGKGNAEAFFSGGLGRSDAARFVNRHLRNDADFRYAYGEKAFRAWNQADAVLKAVPEGQLADHLDVALLQSVSQATFTRGEEPLAERFGHTLRALSGNKLQGGQLRDYVTQTTPHDGLPADQVQNLEALGLSYQQVPLSGGKAIIKYPQPAVMRAGLDQLLTETRAALKDPSSDIVAVAAHFAQQFIALHPFQDENGRIGRLLMDRILAERGVPAPIIADTNSDIALTPTQFKDEVAKGITRSIDQSRGSWSRNSSLFAYSKSILQSRDLPTTKPTDDLRSTMINGLKYAQGPDGFVYDQAGRPHLLDSQGVLQPLSQLAFYFAMRRVTQATDPKAMLAALTASTTLAFAGWNSSAEALAGARVASDQPAMTADNQYRVLLNASGNEAFAAVFNPALSTPEVLFGGSVATSKSTFAMSRYEQLDHEMYLVQGAAERAGDHLTVATLKGYRATLFDQARAFVAQFKDPSRVSPENPEGFKFNYEQIQYRTSPLRFESFAQAAQQGQDRMVVYRGDAGMVKYTGILPDGKPGNSDALEVAKVRADHGGTLNMVGDLVKVGGASGGTGYQSTTTDLALLASASGFAGKSDRVKLNIGALPDWLEKAVKDRLQPGETLSIDTLRDVAMAAAKGRDIPPGKIEISGLDPERLDTVLETCVPADKLPMLRTRIAEARRQADETSPLKRVLSAISDKPVLVDVSDLAAAGPPTDQLTTRLQDQIAQQRDLVTVRRDPSDENSVQVTSYRRAFVVEVDRTAGVPAPGTLGVGSFHREQEISLFDTGLDSTGPRRIIGAFTVEQLLKEFPVVAAAPTAAPQAKTAAPAAASPV